MLEVNGPELEIFRENDYWLTTKIPTHLKVNWIQIWKILFRKFVIQTCFWQNFTCVTPCWIRYTCMNQDRQVCVNPLLWLAGFGKWAVLSVAECGWFTPEKRPLRARTKYCAKPLPSTEIRKIRDRYLITSHLSDFLKMKIILFNYYLLRNVTDIRTYLTKGTY